MIVVICGPLTSPWNATSVALRPDRATLLPCFNRLVVPALDSFISARPARPAFDEAINANADEVAIYHLPRALELWIGLLFRNGIPRMDSRKQNAAGMAIHLRKNALKLLLTSRSNLQDEQEGGVVLIHFSSVGIRSR